MKKYLIALDMDGTLLSSKREICPRTREYLNKLSSQGNIIVIASGRPFRSIEKYYNEIGLDSPCICYNGAYIHSKNNEFEKYSFSLDKDTCKDIYNAIDKSHLMNILCENNNKMYLLKKDEVLGKYFFMDNIDIKYGDLNFTLDTNPNIMIFRAIDEDEKFKKHITSIVESHNLNIRFWSGLSSFSEIYSSTITKAHALEVIRNHYNISKENVIAFGDALNDIEMLQCAGIGVAMKNASEELKSITNYQTEFTNDEDGIMLFLQNIIKEE